MVHKSMKQGADNPVVLKNFRPDQETGLPQDKIQSEKAEIGCCCQPEDAFNLLNKTTGAKYTIMLFLNAEISFVFQIFLTTGINRYILCLAASHRALGALHHCKGHALPRARVL